MIIKTLSPFLFKCFILILFLPSINIIYPQSKVQFYGQAAAGNVVIGKAEKIKSVLFEKKKVSFDEEGYFIIGFDRNAKGKYPLKITFADKTIETHTLIIEPAEYETQKIKGMKRSLVIPPKKEAKRIRAETKEIASQKKSSANLKTAFFKTGFTVPIDSSEMTSFFGSGRVLNGIKRNPHNGVDFNAPTGRAVKAAGDGIVILAENDFFYNGTFVMINHGCGLITNYLHLSKVFVKRGDKVVKGDLIGEVGSTGRSTGPHLHWGVVLGNKRIDPLCLLKLGLNQPSPAK